MNLPLIQASYPIVQSRSAMQIGRNAELPAIQIKGFKTAKKKFRLLFSPKQQSYLHRFYFMHDNSLPT